jgi:hypothetical protein
MTHSIMALYIECAVMLSVAILSVIMLSVGMLNVVMLNVMAPCILSESFCN